MSDTALTATWTSPEGGCAYFLITYKEENTNTPVKEEVPCDKTDVNLEGLEGNGNYTVTIQTIHPNPSGENSTEARLQQWTCKFEMIAFVNFQILMNPWRW